MTHPIDGEKTIQGILELKWTENSPFQKQNMAFSRRENGLTAAPSSTVFAPVAKMRASKVFEELLIDDGSGIKVSSQSRKSEFRVFSIVHLNLCNF